MVLTSVAAQVQAETIPDAMRPGLTEREAEENSSEFRGETPVYLACMAVKPIMKTLKNNPIPRIGRHVRPLPSIVHASIYAYQPLAVRV